MPTKLTFTMVCADKRKTEFLQSAGDGGAVGKSLTVAIPPPLW